jgi:hypothetical protein
MNTYKDLYAVQVINKRKAGKPPRYLTGFDTRSDAENKMQALYSKETYSYKVVYIREYDGEDTDHQGHKVLHTIIEIPEYYSI